MVFFTFFMLVYGKVSAAPQEQIQLTILYDNYLAVEGLETDWGFSCLIKGTEKTILFDTGTQSSILFRNAEKLGADLKEVELVVISHDHGDHTGGLIPFLKTYSIVPVYLLESFSEDLFQQVEQTGSKIISVQEPVQICANVQTTGETGVQIKEQALILNTSSGLVVITGCAHPGVAEMVKLAAQLVDKNIYMVFGGFHLMEMPVTQIKEIIATFKELGVEKVGATHCTGDEAIQMFRDVWGENFVELGVGRTISLFK